MNTSAVFSPKDEDGDGCNSPKIVTALITPAAHSNSATSGNSDLHQLVKQMANEQRLLEKKNWNPGEKIEQVVDDLFVKKGKFYR